MFQVSAFHGKAFQSSLHPVSKVGELGSTALSQKSQKFLRELYFKAFLFLLLSSNPLIFFQMNSSFLLFPVLSYHLMLHILREECATLGSNNIDLHKKKIYFSFCKIFPLRAPYKVKDEGIQQSNMVPGMSYNKFRYMGGDMPIQLCEEHC